MALHHGNPARRGRCRQPAKGRDAEKRLDHELQRMWIARKITSRPPPLPSQTPSREPLPRFIGEGGSIHRPGFTDSFLLDNPAVNFGQATGPSHPIG